MHCCCIAVNKIS